MYLNSIRGLAATGATAIAATTNILQTSASEVMVGASKALVVAKSFMEMVKDNIGQCENLDYTPFVFHQPAYDDSPTMGEKAMALGGLVVCSIVINLGAYKIASKAGASTKTAETVAEVVNALAIGALVSLGNTHN